MIDVLIADDHVILCEGLGKVLASEGDIQVRATAASGPEALQRLRQGGIDLVLLDMSLPGMHGIEILKQIKIDYPRIPVLILSMHDEDQYAVRCIRAGAAGYLNKSCDKHVLLEAVRKAASGGQYITPRVGECLLQAVQKQDGSQPPHKQLSDREYEVFGMIASGLTVQEISQQLSLSPKTVSTYRARILEKMGLHGNADLMRYAYEMGLN